MAKKVLPNVLGWQGWWPGEEPGNFDISSLSEEQKWELLRLLIEDKKKNKRKKTPNVEKLKWDPEKVIADLKENHIKVDENVEMYWFKWKIVHVELPPIWWFKWFNFDYFVSDEVIDLENYEKMKHNINYHTKRSIWELLNNLSKYMQEFWIDLKDETIDFRFDDYFKNFKKDEIYQYLADYRYTGTEICLIWAYARKLLGLRRVYFLWSDKLCATAGDNTGTDFCFDDVRFGKRKWDTDKDIKAHIMTKIDSDSSTPSEDEKQWRNIELERARDERESRLF